MESKSLAPDTDHTPTVTRRIRKARLFLVKRVLHLQQYNPNCDRIEYGLRAEPQPLLHPPKTVDSHRLRSDANKE